MFNILKLYFKNRFGIKPGKANEKSFFLPVTGVINFDSVYSCLADFFLEIGCKVNEESASDGFGNDEFARLIARTGNYVFRLVISSDGSSVLIVFI